MSDKIKSTLTWTLYFILGLIMVIPLLGSLIFIIILIASNANELFYIASLNNTHMYSLLLIAVWTAIGFFTFDGLIISLILIQVLKKNHK